MLNIVTTRWMMMAIASLTMSQCGLALFPGCCAGEEKREPGTHCLRMGQVPLVTCVYSAAQKLNFSWIISVSEELIAFITPSSSSTRSVVTVGIFHMGEGARLAEVSVMEQILQKFPEILGELSIRKQCVRGSFFFLSAPRTSAWEQG